ncbi:hypothetical protein ILUMI_01618 [Ignelater luminosus]|uniref:Cytochrome P450 n=1 Tax=Ignelater luminosus TaxID=2038154 RepID=A0A8K0DI05_IGNLU|nr:hypothetical protein ILUMI_01618 [Ignelater luminosus]
MTRPILHKLSAGEEIRNIYEEYRNRGLRYAGMYILTKPVLLVFEPELIKNIFTRDFQYFTDHGSYLNEKVDPLSGQLFNMKGLKWKNLRAKLTPTFTSGKMKMMFQTLVDCSYELINVMDKVSRKNKALDIKDIVARFTIDIIGSCAFGIECNSLKNPNSEFRNYGKKVFEVKGFQAIKTMLAFTSPQILQFFNIPVNGEDVTNFFLNVVEETVNYRESNNIGRKDFMHLLIQLKNNIKIEEEQNDNLKQMNGGAGFETSSTTLTFCFYELATNPDVQDKLRQEITHVLDKYDGKLTYEAIMEMTYMDKCVYETLRKYPPVFFLTRQCNTPYKVPESDLTIENGTMVIIPIFGIQRDPEYYPNPDKFDPERFSPGNKAKRHAFTWLPFGEGPRECIALRFGLLQVKVALVALLKTYKYTLNSRTKLPLLFDPRAFALAVEGNVWLNSEKLTK